MRMRGEDPKHGAAMPLECTDTPQTQPSHNTRQSSLQQRPKMGIIGPAAPRDVKGRSPSPRKCSTSVCVCPEEGPEVSLGRILGVPSIEPFLGGGGSSQRTTLTPCAPAVARPPHRLVQTSAASRRTFGGGGGGSVLNRVKQRRELQRKRVHKAALARAFPNFNGTPAPLTMALSDGRAPATHCYGTGHPPPPPRARPRA